MNEALYYTATPENQDLEYEMVMSPDYESACDERDAAQVELAALRGELDKWQGVAGRRTAERTEFMNQRDDAQQRLAAAEQRTAEYSAAMQVATRILGQTLSSLNPRNSLAYEVRHFLATHRKTKPTESGASE